MWPIRLVQSVPRDVCIYDVGVTEATAILTTWSELIATTLRGVDRVLFYGAPPKDLLIMFSIWLADILVLLMGVRLMLKIGCQTPSIYGRGWRKATWHCYSCAATMQYIRASMHSPAMMTSSSRLLHRHQTTRWWHHLRPTLRQRCTLRQRRRYLSDGGMRINQETATLAEDVLNQLIECDFLDDSMITVPKGIFMQILQSGMDYILICSAPLFCVK